LWLKIPKVNKDYLEMRIREINDAAQIIREITNKDFDKLSIYEKISLRYLIIQLVEAAAAICIHILANVFNERAIGYPDCFSRLGLKGVIPEELARRLVLAARLRNLLIHRYREIIDEKVYESSKKGLKDFEEYISYIRKFIEKT